MFHVFCFLYIGKTCYLTGYANKQFEFEFEFDLNIWFSLYMACTGSFLIEPRNAFNSYATMWYWNVSTCISFPYFQRVIYQNDRRQMKAIMETSEAILTCSNGFCQIVNRDENPHKKKIRFQGIVLNRCGKWASKYKRSAMLYLIRMKARRDFMAVEKCIHRICHKSYDWDNS